jgi:hypothetical protein
MLPKAAICFDDPSSATQGVLVNLISQLSRQSEERRRCLVSLRTIEISDRDEVRCCNDIDIRSRSPVMVTTVKAELPVLATASVKASSGITRIAEENY